MTSIEEQLLSVSETARICRVSEATVRRHIRAGRLPSVPAEHGVRVRRKDVEAYLASVAGEHRQPSARVRPARPRRFGPADALWEIVGMVSESGEAWISGDKRRALGEAYSPNR